MFMAKISCWFVENGKPKNIRSEVKNANIVTISQVRLYSVDTQVSAAEETGMVKERLSALTWLIWFSKWGFWWLCKRSDQKL